MGSYKKNIYYLRTLFSFIGIFLFIIGSVNYYFNPLGIYKRPNFFPHGEVYPAAINYLRMHKRERVKDIKPEALIIGSSRPYDGINPKDKFFPNLRVYNFGLPASSILEQRKAMEFAQAVNPLKEVVIALDFYGFNALKLENKAFDQEKMNPSHLKPIASFIDRYGTILSLDTFVLSLKHNRYLRKIERYSYPEANGHKVYNDGVFKIKQQGTYAMFEKPNSFGDYSFQYSTDPKDTSFQHLTAMLDLARNNNIKVTIIINPLHKIVLDYYEEIGKLPLFEEWKRNLIATVKANADKYRASPYPLWDFAYHNKITDEDIPAEGDKVSRMKYFWDTNHYKENVGDAILSIIQGKSIPTEYKNFGRKLN